MKPNKSPFFLLIFFSCFVFIKLPAQFSYKVDGVVKENGKTLQGALVTIYDFNSEKIKEILTSATGTFSFSLKPDEEYSFLITKDGYNTVKLIYSTIGMTEDEAKKIKDASTPEVEIFPLPQDVKLLAQINAAKNKPLMSLYYSTDEKKMVSDDDVFQSMKEELSKLQAAAYEEKNKDAIAAQKEAKYTAAITKADKDFAAKNYKAAKDGYNEALAIKPSEQYPKNKISESEKLMADEETKNKLLKEKEISEKYYAAIAKGDKAFVAKDYTGAKAAYNEAIAIKATEQYPKDKIKEMDTLIAKIAAREKDEKDKQAKEKELNDKYAAAITKADAAFFAKDYKAAKAAYNDALMVKATEVYPQTKITECNKFMMDAAEKEKEAKEKEINDKYAATILRADKAFAAKDYKTAKLAYTDANSIKPNEQYPKDKIAEVDKTILENETKDKAEQERLAKEKERLAKEKEINDKYTAAITKADAAFVAKKYSDAKIAYNEALAVKPNEQGPKDKIAECDRLIIETERLAKEKAAADAAEKERLAKEAEKRAFEKKYASIISKGDSLMTAKNYEKAKTIYSEAIQLKADDAYPKEQLKRADVLIAEAELYKNDLAKKYPQGVTEEITKEGNTKVTKRILVVGNKGYLYEKKETNFGAVYFFKDGIAINEQQFEKDTAKK